MGYRSHGYLVFPSVYRGLYQKMCPGTPFDEWDDDTDETGYTVLSFYDWKWYGSYPDVAEIETFMDKLDEMYNDYQYDNDQDLGRVVSRHHKYPVPSPFEELDDTVGQLSFEEMVQSAPWFLPKLKNNIVGTINMFQPTIYKPQDWSWGFNMQGEDTDDYTEKGQIQDLGGFNEGNVENMWSYHYGGQAWKYTFRTMADRDYFAKNFNQVKAGTEIKMDVLDHTKRFEIILHSPSTQFLWDQSLSRAGTDLSDPKKSFALDPSQYDDNDLAFAIWDEYEIGKSQGDTYEMDIYNQREASFQRNDSYTLDLPEDYLEALAKEYGSS